jgi:hypothetical protein
MKKYRLIQTYPGSDTVGTMIIGSKETMYSKGFGYRNYDWAHVETHPEFWEEVIEKDYEIVSYVAKDNPNYITTKRRGAHLHEEYWKIHSVKRLSDGEVFTVGDKFTGYSSEETTIRSFDLRDNILIAYTTNGGCISNAPGTGLFDSINKVIEKDYEILISRIVPPQILSVKRLSDGEVFIVGDRVKVYEYGSIKTITEIVVNDSKALVKQGIWLRYDSGSSHMTHAIKVENPIFLTHDGKYIFEGDTCYVMDTSLNYYKALVTSGSIFYTDTFKYFLTEAAASDYVKRNKVLFTTEDGVGIKKGDTYYFVDTDFSINLSNAHPGCGQYSERKYFSTFETAQYYIILNAKVLSIEEFWEFVSKPGSNIVKQKALKRLVKQRLKIE